MHCPCWDDAFVSSQLLHLPGRKHTTPSNDADGRHWSGDIKQCTMAVSGKLRGKMKKAPREMQKKHCALAVVRRSRKFSPSRRPPFPGARDGQNLISWRWSLSHRANNVRLHNARRIPDHARPRRVMVKDLTLSTLPGPI